MSGKRRVGGGESYLVQHQNTFLYTPTWSMGCPSIALALALTLRSTHGLGDLCVSSVQGGNERIGIEVEAEP